MRGSIPATAALLAVALVSSAAGAQVARPFHVGVAVGGTFPLSDPVRIDASDPDVGSVVSSLESKTGYHFTGLVEFSPPLSPFGLRAEFLYHNLKGETFGFSDPTLGDFQVRPDVRLLGGTVNAILSGTGLTTAVKPYAIGGVGIYNTETKVRASGSLLDALGGATSIKQSGSNVGLNAGIGVRFGLGGVGAFAEARYHYIFNKKDCDPLGEDVCIPRDNTSLIPVSFGIVF